MKKTIAAFILAALAASPAMAKTINQRPAAATQASASYAAMPGTAGRSVAVGYGQILGQDPDPTVRLELERASPLFSGQ